MTAETTAVTARRVVTGVDSEGRSAFVQDAPTQTWVRRPDGSLVMDIWRTESVPTQIDAYGVADEVMNPPAEGVVMRMNYVAPNTNIDAESYAKALAETYGPQPESESGVPGMHRTDTVDVVTVVEGEVYAVLEAGETLLRAGDCLVQRGTIHAWHNRSGKPATLFAIMMPAKR